MAQSAPHCAGIGPLRDFEDIIAPIQPRTVLKCFCDLALLQESVPTRGKSNPWYIEGTTLANSDLRGDYYYDEKNVKYLLDTQYSIRYIIQVMNK